MESATAMKSETNPSITSSQHKATSWIITLNNPTQMEITSWENIKQNHFVKEAVGQIEEGENGTPHIQGYIRTDNVRFSQIKKLFPRAHIEITKNAIAAKQYCQKTDTRKEKLVTSEINTSIHRAVYEQCIHWFRYNKVGTKETDWVTALEDVKDERSARISMLASVDNLHESVREKIFDTAISMMIISGVKHIEFMAVNNLTRSAFKKYFSAIIIREDGFAQEDKRIEKERNEEDETCISQQADAQIQES